MAFAALKALGSDGLDYRYTAEDIARLLDMRLLDIRSAIRLPTAV
jgi:hypothetical protein